MRYAAALLLVAAVVAGPGAAAAPSPLQQEVTSFAVRMERMHPDLFHATPRQRFRAEAADLARQPTSSPVAIPCWPALSPADPRRRLGQRLGLS